MRNQIRFVVPRRRRSPVIECTHRHCRRTGLEKPPAVGVLRLLRSLRRSAGDRSSDSAQSALPFKSRKQERIIATSRLLHSRSAAPHSTITACEWKLRRSGRAPPHGRSRCHVTDSARIACCDAIPQRRTARLGSVPSRAARSPVSPSASADVISRLARMLNFPAIAAPN